MTITATEFKAKCLSLIIGRDARFARLFVGDRTSGPLVPTL